MEKKVRALMNLKCYQAMPLSAFTIYICSIFVKAARNRKDFLFFCGEEDNN